MSGYEDMLRPWQWAAILEAINMRYAMNRARREAKAWFATWLVCVALIFYWLTNAQPEPAIILGVVQWVPIFYAGQAFDRSREEDYDHRISL